VRLERGCYVGAGAVVREGLTVGAGSLVGMGSVVIRDVPPGQVWAGNPARYRREASGLDELVHSAGIRESIDR
jgi:acetyltransferase-like isoleucine patch superfamily enzyme